MFGYIRPQAEELRVKEYTYYRAVYCGVCRSMEKNISPLLSFTLRYDFVLLALVRMLLCGTNGEIVPRRCMANPLRKRPMMADNDALAFSAWGAALLTYYGVLDNIADEHGVKRLLWGAARLPAASMRKKALRDGALSVLDGAIVENLSALHALESAKDPSPDAAAQPFGTLLGELFAFGFSGKEQRIAFAVGLHVGRFIYLCDAADDAIGDETSGAYNPFVMAAAAEGISAKDYLKQHRDRVENALIMECAAAHNAVQLADDAEAHPAWACIENILHLGMPAAAQHVLDAPGVPLSKKDISHQ